MKIEILGPGCAKCKSLVASADAAARKLGLDYELVKVIEIDKIIGYGVMMTPALAVDGKVQSMGKVPSEAELTNLLAIKIAAISQTL
jgi:small redox-active disulfide protein 2